MKKTLSRLFQDVWYQEMYLSTLIMPLSMIYLDIIRLRRFLYRKGFFKSIQLPVPVIIVGNITVGGTGKTPLVIWIANFLAQSGFKPGIISRGYGGQNNTQPEPVNANSDPSQIGDEPVLIARHTEAPIVVSRDRLKAAQFAIEHFACNVIISDDGLQHYALQRDIEIVVIDGQRRFGNGYCLPAGPLREPYERLTEVDLVIVNGKAEEDTEYSMVFLGNHAINLKTKQSLPLTKLCQQPCHALAGIGNPERFFQFLKQKEIAFKPHAFPDHHVFNASEICFNDGLPVLMTEKDAVKCVGFAQHQHWFVPITAQPQRSFSQQLLSLLKRNMMDKKLLDILACPLCKSPLIYDKKNQELICKADRLAFPIRDEIPVMLEDEARELNSEEVDALKK